MSSNENEELARRYVEEAWNEGNLGVVDELFADTWVVHSSSHEHIEDADDLRRHIRMVRKALADFEMNVEFVVAEEDMVTMGIWISGTHEGELMGLDPSNESVEVSGMMAHRFENGAIVESWIDWDVLGFLRQIGAVPRGLQPIAAGG